jgi:hypothetical protein
MILNAVLWIWAVVMTALWLRAQLAHAKAPELPAVVFRILSPEEEQKLRAFAEGVDNERERMLAELRAGRPPTSAHLEHVAVFLELLPISLEAALRARLEIEMSHVLQEARDERAPPSRSEVRARGAPCERCGGLRGVLCAGCVGEGCAACAGDGGKNWLRCTGAAATR